MRFWDSSAIVPLLLEEPATRDMLGLLRDDAEVALWWGSPVECVSALRRRERAGGIDAVGVRRSLDLLALLAQSWAEVLPTAKLRAAAERVLALHPLRAADAFQLAAALAWTRGDPAGAEFVCLDERLADAGHRQGFRVIPN